MQSVLTLVVCVCETVQERSEYAELVERLQSEVDRLKSLVKDQRQQLVADDTKLTATCAALTDKVCIHNTGPHTLLHTYFCFKILAGQSLDCVAFISIVSLSSHT